MDKDQKKKKLIEEKIKEAKQKKVLGNKEGKNVTKPKRSKKRADASKIKHQEKKTVAVGPRGGSYVVGSDGKKEYTMKKAQDFINQFKREKDMSKEEIKKAVDSSSADVDNTPVDEATANGENKPSIQEAATPSSKESPAETPEPVETKASEEPVKAEEAESKEESAKEEEPKAKDISFDGLFADQYQVGSTLEQDPNFGGNVMRNMKKPSMDYVDRAKNHKNVSFSEEDMKKDK